MATARPIDLLHLGAERVVGCYLLETPDGPGLLDCGPTSCLAALEAGLAERGTAVEELAHLFLTHIHLDHAGAAGALVRRNPELRVHVSDVGAPHLAEPTRLEASARRLYGEAFDELWGELVPVPAAQIEPCVPGNTAPRNARHAGLEWFASPGHASHHVCWVDGHGTLYTGDAAGVRIEPHREVLPPTPPPDIDLEAWAHTLDEIERRAPERLALIHFGVFEDVQRHLEELRERLATWAERVELGMPQDEFVTAALGDFPPEVGAAYDHAMPFWQSYAGLRRYWDKRLEA
jgi:glyoxylase-like metal-dependent hydrolase (beta-lactamase superfamily II)